MASVYFTGSTLIRRNIYTTIFKFILIKSRVRAFCWCILRDFFFLLYSPIVLEWIAHVNYNRPSINTQYTSFNGHFPHKLHLANCSHWSLTWASNKPQLKSCNTVE